MRACRRIFAFMFVAATVAVFTTDVRAAEPGSWDLFITGGYTSASLDGGRDKLLGEQSDNGFTGGAGVQLCIYPEFAIELGVRYTQKGGSGTIDSTYSVPNHANVTEPIGNATVSLNYIEIPLLFAWVLDTSPNSWIRAYFGPSINILVDSSVSGTRDGEPIDGSLDDVLKSAEWAGVVGASFDYDFGSFQVLADGRWSIGISSIDDHQPDPSEIKTQTWMFSVGVGIPLSRQGS